MAEGMDFSKRIGPLPLGGWVLVVGAGLTVGFLINKNAAKKASDSVQLAESGVGTGGGSFLPIDPPPPPEAAEETNQSYTNKAIAWLIAQQIDPTVADNAVRKYMNGLMLTPAEDAAMKMVLKQFGPPPEGVGTPPEDPRPSKPNSLAVTMRTSNQIGLSWSPVIGAEYYEVVAASANGTWAPQRAIIPMWNSGPKLGSNLDHTFYVYAVNDFGKSEPSTITAKTSGGGIIPPVVPPKVPPKTPPKPPPPKPKPRYYTIQRGDTLWSISTRFYRTGTSWMRIYNANAGTIEAAARRHGRSSSRGPGGIGWWIYPGTQLVIP